GGGGHQRRRAAPAFAARSRTLRDHRGGRRRGAGHFHRSRGRRAVWVRRFVPRRTTGAWREKVKRVVMGLLIAASLLPASLAAQAVTGTILGTVTDSSGAAVPGATVTLTHTGTGLVRTLVTDANGEYTAPSLPTGTYKLVAELPGFKTVSQSDIP